MKDYNKRRSPRGEKKNRKAIWVIIPILLGLIALVLFGRSSYFEIDEVYIEGKQELNREDIMEKVDEQELNYWLINLEKLEESLKDNHWIKETPLLKKEFPNTLFINVSERRPAAVWRSGETYYKVSSDLMILEREEQPSGQYPYLSGFELSEGEAKIGEKLHKDLSSKFEILFEEILARDIMEVDEIYKHNLQQVKLFIPGERVVRLGRLEQVEEKMHAFSLVKEEYYQKSSDYVLDLRVPEQPVLIQPEDME